MLVDGKKIAADIYTDIRLKLDASGTHPCLAVFACVPNVETRKYLELKKARAMELGVDVLLLELDPNITTSEAVTAVTSAPSAADGILIQLPFPPPVDMERVLAAIPKALDVDAMNYHGEQTDVLPPVVGAIAEIAQRHGVGFTGKSVVVVGRGRLVGKPAAFWAKAEGADVTVVDKDTPNAAEALRQADIIISGAGVPGLITPDKIKEGVMIFDAGTSEEGGILRGDADPVCANKAALFTPVPGGIGPVTIAILLRNLVRLSESCSKPRT